MRATGSPEPKPAVRAPALGLVEREDRGDPAVAQLDARAARLEREVVEVPRLVRAAACRRRRRGPSSVRAAAFVMPSSIPPRLRPGTSTPASGGAAAAGRGERQRGCDCGREAHRGRIRRVKAFNLFDGELDDERDRAGGFTLARRARSARRSARTKLGASLYELQPGRAVLPVPLRVRRRGMAGGRRRPADAA